MRFLEESDSETESEVVVSRGWGERGAWGVILQWVQSSSFAR